MTNWYELEVPEHKDVKLYIIEYIIVKRKVSLRAILSPRFINLDPQIDERSVGSICQY